MKNKKNQNPIEEKEDMFKNTSMKLFFMLSTYLLLILVIYSITQLLNINNILGLIEIVSIAVPIIYILLKEEKTKSTIGLIAIFLFMTSALPYLYNKTYDLTWDGNTYHKTAIAFIKNGWNPIYQDAMSFQKNNSNVAKIDKESRTDLWIEHYPKATWIIAAVMYNLTGNIESGKCITLILTVMAMILSYNILRKIIDKKWAIVITLAVALNPIVLAQFFTYYVDGIMGICFLIELLLLFKINPQEKQDLRIWICLASITAVFSNLKYTGFMCSGVIAAVFYFYWIIKYRKEKDFFANWKKITGLFVIVYLVAVFLVGSNSYIKNTIDHMNPLYPIIGKDKVDIITTMQPKSFGKKNSIEKFFISLFSVTKNVTYDGGDPTLKSPLKVYRSEISELYSCDVRIGGFGPLFALTIIISLILSIIFVYKLAKNEKKNIKIVVLTVLAIIISMALLGESWWARYVPQFYLIPVGVLLLGVYTSKYFNYRKIQTCLSLVLLGVMMLNIACFGYVSYKTLGKFVRITSDLKELKNTKDLIITIPNKEHIGFEYNLKDLGIDYKKVETDKYIPKYEYKIGVVENETISKTN